MDITLPQLLQYQTNQNASDLHIASGSPPRIRLDGQLLPIKMDPLTPQQSMELCYSILTEEQKKVFEKNKEIDLAFTIEGVARFRANIFLDSQYVAGAFRLIPAKIYSLQELALPPLMQELCALPRGLVLVTGPTGSGKSTSLAAMIDHINQHRYEHIVTIEDPVEFVHKHKNCMINQREIGQDTESFSRALKSVLRQDPDVVLIGEMRDLETVRAAITTAETGHLVFATLHTNNCVSSLNRIIDVFPPHQQEQIRTQLSMNLEAVISQILLPAKGGGRVMAMEIMRANSAIRALITEGKFTQIYSAMQTGQADSHMQTMNQALYRLVEQRYIDKDLALEKSSKKDELNEMLLKRNANRRAR